MNDIDPLSILAAFGAAEAPAAESATGGMMIAVAALIAVVWLNSLFVACQFALMKARESRFAPEEDVSRKQRRKMVLAKKELKHSELFLATCQLGLTFASLALGFIGLPFMTMLTLPCLRALGMQDGVAAQWVALGVTFALFFCIHTVMGQFIPRYLALKNPEKMLMNASGRLYFYYRVFKYTFVLRLSKEVAHFIMRYLMGVNPEQEENVTGTDELMYLVNESERSRELTKQEAEISKNALELNDMCVKDIMTPRSEVDVMDLTAPFEQNWELARNSWHTRFPLVEGDHLDDVKGWVHVKDLLRLVGQDRPDLMSVRRELRVVPDTMPLDNLLSFFLKEHVHFALVVDEFGDSMGLVFLDDILEQIVGDDIQDEFDREEMREFVKTGKDTYAVAGGISLFDLADYMPELELESPAVTTLGGYIISKLGHIPEEGEELEIEGFNAVVTGSDGRRITQVVLTRLPEKPEEEEEE